MSNPARFGKRLLILCFIACLNSTLLAQPRGPQDWWPSQPREMPFVHPLFCDDTVMQRDIPAPIWGWATAGEKIAVQVDGKLAGEAVAGNDGRWMTHIGPF